MAPPPLFLSCAQGVWEGISLAFSCRQMFSYVSDTGLFLPRQPMPNRKLQVESKASVSMCFILPDSEPLRPKEFLLCFSSLWRRKTNVEDTCQEDSGFFWPKTL